MPSSCRTSVREYEAVTIRVVGAALVRDGRVLTARRAAPSDLAGGWEFPGGKVEPGESDVAALARELREELGVKVTVGGLLGHAADGPIELYVYEAALADGEPRPLEDHDELRWLSAAELDAVAWLPIDAALLPAVTDRLLLR
jgi:8-oxo-dGTP diphosphatase